MTYADLFALFKYPSALSGIVGVVIGLALFSGLAKAQKWAFAFCSLAFIVDTTGLILESMGIWHPYIYHAYTIVETFILFFLFREAGLKFLRGNSPNAIWILFLVMGTINGIFWEPFRLNTNTILLASLLTLVYCLSYLRKKLSEQHLTPLYKDTFLLPTMGLLFYATGTFFIWVSFSLYPNNVELRNMILFFNTIFTMLKNLAFAYFIWKTPSTP